MNDHDPKLYDQETRTLRDEQGVDRVVIMPKIYWGSFDFIIKNTTMTAGELLAIADEEAPTHNMTWHDYLPEGLAHIDHYYMERPHLWNCNRDQDGVVGYIGPVSNMQIEELERSKTPIDD